MTRHQDFMARHQSFVDYVKRYVSDNGLDFVLMIGDGDDFLLPWEIKRKQNFVIVNIIEEIDDNSSGTIHAEHYKTEEEMLERAKELNRTGPDSEPIKH